MPLPLDGTVPAHGKRMDCDAERLWWAAALTCSLRTVPYTLPCPILVFPSVAHCPFVPVDVHVPGPCVEDVLCAMCLSRLRNES